MRWLLVAALSAGCFTKEVKQMTNDLHQGGTISLAAPCNYTVKTPDGASVPDDGDDTWFIGSDGTPQYVHLGVPGDPTTTMAVLWRTNDNETLATQVQYGLNGKTDQTAHGFTFVYDTGTGGSVRMHETHLCGLAPDTEYTYRAGGIDAGGKETWSQTYTFRTAPKDPNAELLFLVIGDTRDGYDVWGNSLKQALQIDTPDYVLFSGDATTLGPIQDEWDAWFKAADPLLASLPMIYAHGNHDVNSTNYFSQFAQPGNEQDFAMDMGPLHLTVANDTPVDSADLQGLNAQLLDQHLNTNQPWSILIHHKPMFSAAAGPHPEDVTMERMAWESIVDAHRVDLDLSGHDHDYERSKPVRNGKVGNTNADGTVFVVVGSAGAPLYDKGSDFWTAYSEKTYSFALVRVKTGLITINAYRQDGSVLDNSTLTK
jgi:hypothetical protein